MLAQFKRRQQLNEDIRQHPRYKYIRGRAHCKRQQPSSKSVCSSLSPQAKSQWLVYNDARTAELLDATKPHCSFNTLGVSNHVP